MAFSRCIPRPSWLPQASGERVFGPGVKSSPSQEMPYIRRRELVPKSLDDRGSESAIDDDLDFAKAAMRLDSLRNLPPVQDVGRLRNGDPGRLRAAPHLRAARYDAGLIFSR